jgi:hypothetical protein
MSHTLGKHKEPVREPGGTNIAGMWCAGGRVLGDRDGDGHQGYCFMSQGTGLEPAGMSRFAQTKLTCFLRVFNSAPKA